MAMKHDEKEPDPKPHDAPGKPAKADETPEAVAELNSHDAYRDKVLGDLDAKVAHVDSQLETLKQERARLADEKATYEKSMAEKRNEIVERHRKQKAPAHA